MQGTSGGAGNILFLDLGVAYAGVLTWRKFVQLLTVICVAFYL